MVVKQRAKVTFIPLLAFIFVLSGIAVCGFDPDQCISGVLAIKIGGFKSGFYSEEIKHGCRSIRLLVGCQYGEPPV